MSDDMLFNKVLNIDTMKQLKVSADSSLKYGAFVGATTIVSGILGGRAGLLIGGLAGSYLAGYVASGKYESVPYILMYKTTKEEKEKLLKEIRDLILSYGISIYQFISSANNARDLEKGIIGIVISLLAKRGLQVYSD